MPTGEINLVGTWSIESGGWYLLSAAASALGIRFVLSAWKACEVLGEVRFRTAFAENFKGFGQNLTKADYWTAFALGFMELLSYPVLIAFSAWEFIGFWLGLKTVAQWAHWQTNRIAFNRFLIGNGLVLLLALLLSHCYVETTQEDQDNLIVTHGFSQNAQAVAD